MSLKFVHPFTCMVAGPTSSGKTVLVENLLRNHAKIFSKLSPSPKILWCHGQDQERYKPNTLIEYHDGLIEDPSGYDIIIVDDLMNEMGNNNRLLNLFTKGSHHMKISVFFIVQNIFHQAKNMRGISLNCQYLILMKNPRDKSQIHCLARQLYPTKTKLFIKVFEDATRDPYSYLKVDLTPQTPENLRVQACLSFTKSTPTVVVYEI